LGRRVDAEVDRLLDSALRQAREILVKPAATSSTRLAERLLEVETMSGAELTAIVSTHATVELQGVVVPRAAASTAVPVATTALPAIAVARRPAGAAGRRGTAAATLPPPWLRTLLRAVTGPRGGRPRPGGLSG
jgi:hypothetical protein